MRYASTSTDLNVAAPRLLLIVSPNFIQFLLHYIALVNQGWRPGDWRLQPLDNTAVSYSFIKYHLRHLFIIISLQLRLGTATKSTILRFAPRMNGR